ncbi:MAG: YraN family protein [Lachnospiraceae bacterium]|nr:YraN family protein [Lachnospiraceae bacterium]
MNKRKIGSVAESMAVEYLKKKGVVILDRNFYSRSGEIDIVGIDGEYLVFFEVKYREGDSCGDPGEAVTPAKIKRIIKAARFYMLKNGISEDSFIRFDVIAMTQETVNWIKNAFEAF